jgi:hypothetical protein
MAGFLDRDGAEIRNHHAVTAGICASGFSRIDLFLKWLDARAVRGCPWQP